MSKCAYEPLTDQERLQFVCSFFINNNDLYLHLGPGGPVEIFNKTVIHKLATDESGAILLYSAVEIYRITRSSLETSKNSGLSTKIYNVSHGRPINSGV